MNNMIRRALKEDCEKIVNDVWKPFIELCCKYEFSGLDKKAEISFYHHLLDIVDNPDSVVYIAEYPPMFVGYVVARKRMNTPIYEVKFIGEITDLFVRPEYRERGIGEQLVEAAEDWLSESGLDFVWINIHIGNELGRTFWENREYKDYTIKKIKKLGQERR
jgi:GNAT superfamily N-acetyltransferase